MFCSRIWALFSSSCSVPGTKQLEARNASLSYDSLRSDTNRVLITALLLDVLLEHYLLMNVIKYKDMLTVCPLQVAAFCNLLLNDIIYFMKLGGGHICRSVNGFRCWLHVVRCHQLSFVLVLCFCSTWPLLCIKSSSDIFSSFEDTR